MALPPVPDGGAVGCEITLPESVKSNCCVDMLLPPAAVTATAAVAADDEAGEAVAVMLTECNAQNTVLMGMGRLGTPPESDLGTGRPRPLDLGGRAAEGCPGMRVLSNFSATDAVATKPGNMGG